ncbi:sn-glycerol-3-phosphate ABC transporter ATP-binding protein UgpC [Terrarubrum flagellatum]|uniref:ABC transporter ATP-binding protein n=1 Tax=Terrirubrum flagellatum TaxID=2895980 RepID=UPI003145372E
MAEISIRDVRKSYDAKEILHGLSLDVANGEFVVIVGPSGCGKSTLLRMIAGLEDITHGEIAINREVVNDIDPADRGCAMVFQNYALYPHMTVRENMGYPLRIARMPKDLREKRVAELAAILDLSDYLDRRPNQLSGGQRQRVAMGRAIAREPAVFLFDEPLSNLDAKLRVQMRIEIKRLHKRLKATSIFVTHDQVEAMTLADKLVVMNGGRIEQIGSPASVYRRPASTFVASFLGAPPMNLASATVAGPRQISLDGAPNFVVPTANDLPLKSGAPVTIGVRPEDIVLTTDAGQGLGGRIDLIEELGGSQVAYCQTLAQEFSVVLPRGSAETEDQQIFMRFPAACLHLFDAQTGQRI